MVSPRAMVITPSVATNGGTLNFVMTIPLNAPNAAPAASAPRQHPQNVKPKYVSMPAMANPLPDIPATIAPDRASTDPTDKSIPPVRMTSVIPTDIHRLMDVCRSTLNRLSDVRKFSDKNDMAMHINRSAASGFATGCDNIFFIVAESPNPVSRICCHCINDIRRQSVLLLGISSK